MGKTEKNIYTKKTINIEMSKKDKTTMGIIIILASMFVGVLFGFLQSSNIIIGMVTGIIAIILSFGILIQLRIVGI